MVDSEAEVHCTDELDVHDAVAQAAAERTVLVVKSLLPKLSPLTVTEDPPLRAVLSMSLDENGASKLNFPPHVPATAPTVTTP